MPDDQPASTKIIDLAATAVSPVLVALMVGSLVFFLTEVGYRGEYPGRMLYTLFFFVAGCVLIARLSIAESRQYAAIYALGLGFATFLALVRWSMDVDVGLVASLLLMPVIWWATDLLTWDCTHFAEDRKASGRGLLAAAGLDEPADEPEADAPKKVPDGWLERWQQYRADRRKRPHTPGVYVLYFALAALPVFALGQSLIDPTDTDRRRACFLDMAVYIGSALGLLVTTSLMGLRKYLEARGAKVPAVLTLGWLGLGSGLILTFLVVGALLPRPHSETPWFGASHASNRPPSRSASKNAVVKGSDAGKGQGASGSKTEKGEGKQSAKGGEQKGGNAGEKGSGGGKGQSKGGQEQQKGNDGDKSDDRSDGPKSQPKRGDQQKGSQQKGEQKSDDDRKDQKQGEQSRDADDTKTDAQADGQSASERISQMSEAVGSVLRWVTWVFVAVLVIAGVVYFLVKGLAPFTKWAQSLLDWWRSLFARKPTAGGGGADVVPVKAVERPPPFLDFRDPFADGSAKRKTAAELVSYTFAALDSWAWDRDRGRKPGETPQEFAVRLGTEFEPLDDPGFKLAVLYGRVLYARGGLPADAKTTLAAVWQALGGGRDRKGASG